MSDLFDLTIDQLITDLKNKKISSIEVTKSYLARIKEYNKNINAYITVCDDLALAQAKKIDEEIAKGKFRLLSGLPMAIKDNFCIDGIRTTSGSNMLSDFYPNYTSTIVEQLFDVGAICLGKANLDEFSMGSSGTTSYYGYTKSPWKNNQGEHLVPGGSSSGSAAAVAAKLALAATGTDTGGSIRQPASYCGLVGIKPTYGTCSRYGIIPLANSLDQAGVLARNVKDAAIVMQAMAKKDEKDCTSISNNLDISKINGNIKGKKIGIPIECNNYKLNNDISKAWNDICKQLISCGAEIKEVSLPNMKSGIFAYYVICSVEASSALAKYDGIRCGLRASGDSVEDIYYNTRTQGFGYEVKRRIAIGNFILSNSKNDYYRLASKVRALIVQDCQNVFDQVDCLFMPTTSSTALSVEQFLNRSPVDAYLDDLFTVPASLAGLPALSLPGGLSSDNLPIGFQVIGKHFAESEILSVATAIENIMQNKDN